MGWGVHKDLPLNKEQVARGPPATKPQAMGGWGTHKGQNTSIPQSTGRKSQPEAWPLCVRPAMGTTMMCEYVEERWERKRGRLVIKRSRTRDVSAEGNGLI